MTFHPSGQQHEISLGDQHATIVEVGGGIREYRVGEADVLQPYAADQMCDGAHGAPWCRGPTGWRTVSTSGRARSTRSLSPSRRSTTPSTASSAGAASSPSGTTRPAWSCGDAPSPARLPFRPGRPRRLPADAGGADRRDHGHGPRRPARAVRLRTAPVLSPADGLVDDCRLTLEAATRIVTDPERSLPTGTEPVAGTPYDFQTGARSASWRSTAPSPTCAATRRAGRGSCWIARTGGAPGCGSTPRAS